VVSKTTVVARACFMGMKENVVESQRWRVW
jgi:hypothetical protein